MKPLHERLLEAQRHRDYGLNTLLQEAAEALKRLDGPKSGDGDVAVPLSVVWQVESALSIQLANTMQPDRQRSYEALEALRTILTQSGNERSTATWKRI